MKTHGEGTQKWRGHTMDKKEQNCVVKSGMIKQYDQRLSISQISFIAYQLDLLICPISFKIWVNIKLKYLLMPPHSSIN